ncbi:MAG TPA: galactokinase [Terriglobales bacterium]|nr:galactokinase [Terriglobales bacterium]
MSPTFHQALASCGIVYLMNPAELAQLFRQEYDGQPLICRAPGRVNLIGEHTDYNDGFVLPCAIEFSVLVAASARSDHKLFLRSTEFSERFEFDLHDLPPKGSGVWADYVVGVAAALKNAGSGLSGANLLVHGEVPIGAGLSSSAAIEVATALSLLGLIGGKTPLPEVAKLCQSAENEFVGARVGIMDQFVSCLGKTGHALLLDCRSLRFELVPVPEKVKLVICNTMVKHALAGGEYNRRREQCEEGLSILAKSLPGISALRDVTPEQLASRERDLPPMIYKRCLHVVEENRRVGQAAECLRSGDLGQAGRLMRESHRSLRDLYEVSCRELDEMVEAADGVPGCFGGRMTGGGFGGCTVNLVDAGDAEAFCETVAQRYKQRTGISPEIYVCSPAEGARLELKV